MFNLKNMILYILTYMGLIIKLYFLLGKILNPEYKNEEVFLNKATRMSNLERKAVVLVRMHTERE